MKKDLAEIKTGRCFGSFACALEENVVTVFRDPDKCPAKRDCASCQGIKIGTEVKVI